MNLQDLHYAVSYLKGVRTNLHEYEIDDDVLDEPIERIEKYLEEQGETNPPSAF